MHARQRRRGGTAHGTALVLLTVRVCGWRLGVLKPTRNCFHRRGCHPLSPIHRTTGGSIAIPPMPSATDTLPFSWYEKGKEARFKHLIRSTCDFDPCLKN